jgi:threonine dehydratase
MKAEHLQKVGAYKARGATNQVRTLLENGPAPPGVVAASSGNHGQAVAWAAGLGGIPATVVVPDWIAPPKRAAIEGYGARIVVQAGSHDVRNRAAAEIAAAEGLVDIPPYDHPVTIAGQGTWVLEALEDTDGDVETIVVPIGGGGLASGTALGAAAAGSSARIYGVEPAGADDTRRSMEAGHRVSIEHPDSVADALLANQPGRITFGIMRARLAGVLTVSDDEILAAMRLIWERAKQVVEPAGATALAAALTGRVPGSDPVLVMLSGGNVDLDGFRFTR